MDPARDSACASALPAALLFLDQIVAAPSVTGVHPRDRRSRLPDRYSAQIRQLTLEAATLIGLARAGSRAARDAASISSRQPNRRDRHPTSLAALVVLLLVRSASNARLMGRHEIAPSDRPYVAVLVSEAGVVIMPKLSDPPKRAG